MDQLSRARNSYPFCGTIGRMNIRSKKYTSWNVISVAACHGNLDVIDVLARDNENLNTNTRNPVIEAVDKNRVDALKLLGHYGANLNITDGFGRTAIFHAIELRLYDGLDYLIRSGGDVHQRDENRNTPLHAAVSTGCLGIVKLLLEENVDLWARNNFGIAPLDLAMKLGFIVIPQMLIERILLKDPTLGIHPDVKRSEISHYWLQCKIEIRKMRTLKVEGCRRLNLLVFLSIRNPTTLLYFIYKCIVPPPCVMRNMLRKDIPIYTEIVVHQFKVAKQRESVMRRALLVMKHSALNKLDVPGKFHIVRYLNNDHLRKVIRAAPFFASK